jgi:hypothetical protein
MAVTVNQLCKKCNQNYGLKAVAGFNGFNNLVEWVHIMESSNVGAFLRGQELVFTTGVMNNTGRWLLEFVKQLDKASASGLIVNIGPYIPTIDTEVIEYCNERNFPLFTLPWKTRVVDMTRDFCTIISQSINHDTDVSNAFKNLVLNIGNRENQLTSLESGGFNRSGSYYVVCIGSRNSDENLDDKVNVLSEQTAKAISDLYCSFEYNCCIIALLYKYNKLDLEAFCKDLKNLCKSKSIEISIGVSSKIDGMDKKTKGFEYAVSAYNMAVKRDFYCMFYEDMDIYKLFVEVSDKSVLKDYYNEVLGKLEEYDNEHGSNYLEFLKTYLDNNASPQLVSEKEFIHRNTVVNYLKKIDTITSMNLFDLGVKVKCIIAFAIRDFL